MAVFDNYLFEVQNPAALGLTQAEVVLAEPRPDQAQLEAQTLIFLDQQAENCAFFGRYFIQA